MKSNLKLFSNFLSIFEVSKRINYFKKCLPIDKNENIVLIKQALHEEIKYNLTVAFEK